MMSLDKDIEALAGLKKNWDSYEGEPPSEAALNVLRNMQFRPTVNGGVVVTFNAWKDEIELEFRDDGRVQNIAYDRDTFD
jgi:hypothetical protein